jgi:hypothetical protein
VSLARKEIVPFFTWFILLLITTVVIDLTLHFFNIVWIGYYLGPIGTLTILSSFLYSLRKRNLIKSGSPKKLLEFHEYAAWLGSLMILVHAGIHINAILPWIAVLGLLVAFGSGVIGKILLKRSRDFIKNKKELYKNQGLSEEEIETQMFWSIASVNLMKDWRDFHQPITILFVFLSLAHIITAIIY